MSKLRYFIADIFFLIGNVFVGISAKLMGYHDTAESLQKQRAAWLKEDAFKYKGRTKW